MEGLTEELSLPIYLETVGLDITQEGIEIIGSTRKVKKMLFQMKMYK